MVNVLVSYPYIYYQKEQKCFETTMTFLFEMGLYRNMYSYRIQDGELIRHKENIVTHLPDRTKEEMIAYHNEQVEAHEQRILMMVSKMEHFIHSDKEKIRIIDEIKTPLAHRFTLLSEGQIRTIFSIIPSNEGYRFDLSMPNFSSEFIGVVEDIKEFLFLHSKYRLKFVFYR